jgi:carbon-monoxide dehydrogenase medium subunit
MGQTQAVKLFRPQTYFRAGSVAEATQFLLEHDGSVVIAGGTDLLVEKNCDIMSLVDITRLGLDYIRVEEKLVRIGACTTFTQIEKDATLRRQPYSSLVEAARTIGGVAIRNEATIGGNICNAVPSADSAPPLMVLDSKVRITSQNGERTIPLEDFFLHLRKVDLKKGEMVTEIQIPQPPPHTGTSFMKLGRAADDISVVNAAARVTMGQGKTLQDVKLVLGAVAPVPLRAKKAEAQLMQRGVASISEVAETAADEAKPISDVRASVGYRRDMCRVLSERVLRMALDRAEAN